MKNDTVIIGFYGIPQLHNETVEIPKEIFDYKIKINIDW
jgi:hypothetical protein